MQPFTFFVSYRRQDTAPIALLLKSEIERRLQFVRVSVDVEELSPGDDFPDHLKTLISQAHATIALIGKQWMPRRKGREAGRVADDWVARELEHSALAPLTQHEDDRYGLTARQVIPIFVDCKGGFEQFVLPNSIAYLSHLQSESIDYASWPRAIGPLIDIIARKLGLEKRPEKDKYAKPDLAKAKTQPLADKELKSILAYHDYEGWYVDNFGDADARYLAKTFEFRHFDQAAEFMTMVADHCRVFDHHPEWRNVFKHVQVALTTWDAHRKVTIYDVGLALYMNMAAKTVAKRH